MQKKTGKPEICVWNLYEDGRHYAGAQRIFNILGHVSHPEDVETLAYTLNGGPLTPIAMKRVGINAGQRLQRIGDFNIDTISNGQLIRHNKLVLIAQLTNGTRLQRTITFYAYCIYKHHESFHLDPSQIRQAQEIGQLVDGRWRVSQSRRGERCLEIRPEDAGLDRIILFGHRKLRTGYLIKARLRVNAWMGTPHNVGLLFHWNPHTQGDGRRLPSQWSTGLGYYYSECPGLRIRLGLNVHLNAQGRKVGDNLLAEAVLSRRRYALQRLSERLFGVRTPVAQLVPRRQYEFALLIEKERYALTVWKSGKRRPDPQIIVSSRPDLLPEGAVGIIAHRCAVQLFEFEIIPSS